jgi:hypothetical protein
VIWSIVAVLAAWSGAIIVDSVARPGSHDGLVLSLPAVAILGIAAILFFCLGRVGHKPPGAARRPERVR